MNDDYISKLATKLTETLATKEDLKRLEGRLEGRLVGVEGKLTEINHKADTILQYVDALDDEV